MSISVFVVEDDARLRDRFVRAIACADDLHVAGAAADLAEGLRCVDQLRPEVLLVDLVLPDGNGITLIRHVARCQPRCATLVITIFDDDERVVDCIRAGAIGYLLKDARDLEIVGGIREVCRGGSPISAAIARRLVRWLNGGAPSTTAPPAVPAGASTAPACGVPDLSAQEAWVLQLFARGCDPEEVAALLKVRRSTVATCVGRIFRKLQVHSATEAVHEARRLGLRDD